MQYATLTVGCIRHHFERSSSVMWCGEAQGFRRAFDRELLRAALQVSELVLKEGLYPGITVYRQVLLCSSLERLLDRRGARRGALIIQLVVDVKTV